MGLPERKNNYIPRSNISSGLSSSIENIPLPVNTCDTIKKDIEKLEFDPKKPKCVKCVCTITAEKNIHDWQMYISSICSNYSRKLQGSVKFTVRIIDDNTIGIWRKK